MTRNDLYGAAFRYKKAGPWKKLWDTQIFAIRLTSGEVGYLCVMGKGGEYCALGLYIGVEGFKSYRSIAKPCDGSISPFASNEHYLQHDCLQLVLTTKDDLMSEEIEEVRAFAQANGIKLAGKNTFPQFIKYKPGYHPWVIRDSADINALCEAAEASILVAELLKRTSPEEIGLADVRPETAEVPLFIVKDGVLVQDGFAPLPPEEPKQYEKVIVKNDIAIAKMKRLPKKGVWESELIRMLEPLQINPDEAPYFPMCLIMAESQSGYLLPADPIMDYEEHPEQVLDWLIDALEEQGTAPKEIKCRDDRTFALLQDLCSKTGIKLKLAKGPLQALEDAEEDLLNIMTDSDMDDDTDAECLAELEDIIELLLSMPKSAVKQMPQSLLAEMRFIVDAERDILPKAVVRELKDKLGIE